MDLIKIALWMAALIILAALVKILEKKTESKINARESYKARPLLTKHELQEYYKMKPYVEAKGWKICPKVRLYDLIEPKRGIGKKQILINKIQSKHVDFVLVDQDMKVVAVLELDDSSHDRPDRKARDSFVREALEGAGITMLQIRSVADKELKDFMKESEA